MEIYRVSREEFAGSLTPSGKANRWNYDDQLVIYAGSSRSLATLELIVNKSFVKPAIVYKVMVISIADNDNFITHITEKDLPKNWRGMGAYAKLQQIGSEWYKNQSSLLLKIPSAVIPKEHNYLINTKHPDFEENVVLVRKEDYFWDKRLLSPV